MTDPVKETPVENFDYDKEFADQVAKREAEKRGETPEPTESTPEPAEAAPKEAATEAKAEQKTDEVPLLSDDEVLAAVPEDRREAVRTRLAAEAAQRRKLENDNRSIAGRVSVYQKRYEEAVGKRPVEAAKAASKDQLNDWEALETDYPAIAAGIKQLFEAKGGNASNLEELTQFVADERRTRFLNDAFDSVEAIHPGWRDVVATPVFQEWKKTSPTYEKLASSDEITDAIALMDLWNVSDAAQGAASTEEQETREADEQAEESQKLSARREAQVAGARSAKGRTESPNQDVDLNDADQLFSFYAKKADARMKRRYQ